MHIFVKQNRNTMTEKQFNDLYYYLQYDDDLAFSSKTRDYFLIFSLNLESDLIEIESLEQKIKGVWDYCEYKLTADQEIKLYESAIELKKESDYQKKMNEQEYNERWK